MQKCASFYPLSMPCHIMAVPDESLQGEHIYNAAWLKAHIAGHVCWTRHRFPLAQGNPVPSGYADLHMPAQDLLQAAARPLICCGCHVPICAMHLSLFRALAVLQAAERSARQALPTHWGAPKALAQASLRDPNSGSLLPACESTQDLIVRGAYTSWSCCKELEASNSSMPFDAVHRCPALQQATMQDKRQPDL